jgi:hypothetical protein
MADGSRKMSRRALVGVDSYMMSYRACFST